MPRSGFGRRCAYCGKKVSTPCETKKNSEKCANKRGRSSYKFLNLIVTFLENFISKLWRVQVKVLNCNSKL